MDTALRNDRSYSGNSSLARGDAEYTDAPASDTIIYCTSGHCRITSAASASDSREAVPFPIAMIFTFQRAIICFISSTASLYFFCGGWGYITPTSSTLPVSSTTASLQPVRNPGSTPSTTRPFTGACSSRLCKLAENTLMACSSPRAVSSLRTSRSIAGPINRFQLSRAAVSKTA